MHPHSTAADGPSAGWSTLRQLLPHLRDYRNRIALALGCLILAKLASVALPFALKHIVDFLDQRGEQSEITRLTLLPLALLLAYGGLRFANVLFGELRDTVFGRVTERAMRNVGLSVFCHLHQLDLAFHLNRRTGGLSRDIERGTNGISFLLRFMVFNIIPTFVEIGLVIVLLGWRYSGWFALIVLLAVLVYIGFSVVATEWRTAFIRRANEAESRSSARAVDSLLNFETVKYFNNEAHEADLYDRELANWESARRQNRLSLFVLNAGQALIIATAMTAAMMLAAQRVLQQDMTLGDFALINAFMMQIFMPLNFLGFVYREMKGSLANIEALFALLRQQPSFSDPVEAKELKITEGRIDVQQLSFAYRPDRPILQDISFSVVPGQKVALVGASGAGKSTLLKLLLRFYPPGNGQILIDHQDLAQCSQSSLRRQLGIVPQDTVLFNQSILENVRYGNINASDGEVLQAIAAANLGELIRTLPEGVNTLVGERGLKLSGGEKQRVAIARALLKGAPIMIFDEATSSLDSRSERLILDAISNIARDHTLLVVAHRLSTIVDADCILVLDEGRIVERGHHQQLLALGGHYAALWAAQQRQQPPGGAAHE